MLTDGDMYWFETYGFHFAWYGQANMWIIPILVPLRHFTADTSFIYILFNVKYFSYCNWYISGLMGTCRLLCCLHFSCLQMCVEHILARTASLSAWLDAGRCDLKGYISFDFYFIFSKKIIPVLLRTVWNVVDISMKEVCSTVTSHRNANGRVWTEPEMTPFIQTWQHVKLSSSYR